MFKTEPHVHMSEVSPCSKINAAEMVRIYYEAGYNTIIVSDHYKQRFFDSLGDIPWQDKVTIFLSGYYKAKCAAEKYGITVLMAAEITFNDAPNDYLVYGITKEFLCEHPELYKLTAEEFYKKAKECGVFVVQAHPFRDGKCFPTPEYADAFEIYNSNPRHQDFSDKSEACAKENGLYLTAGSDAHRPEDVAKSGVVSDTPINSNQDYIDLIKSGKAIIFKG